MTHWTKSLKEHLQTSWALSIYIQVHFYSDHEYRVHHSTQIMAYYYGFHCFRVIFLSLFHQNRLQLCGIVMKGQRPYSTLLRHVLLIMWMQLPDHSNIPPMKFYLVITASDKKYAGNAMSISSRRMNLTPPVHIWASLMILYDDMEGNALCL